MIDPILIERRLGTVVETCLNFSFSFFPPLSLYLSLFLLLFFEIVDGESISVEKSTGESSKRRPVIQSDWIRLDFTFRPEEQTHGVVPRSSVAHVIVIKEDPVSGFSRRPEVFVEDPGSRGMDEE